MEIKIVYFVLFHTICNTEDRHSEISSLLTKLSKSGNIIKTLSWIYHWLIELKITKIYYPIDMHHVLFSNYLFKVYYENSTNTVDYGTGNIVCHLLFSSNYEVGRFGALQNNSNSLKPSNFDGCQLIND